MVFLKKAYNERDRSPEKAMIDILSRWAEQQ
jgi:hypothetical protein